MKQKFSESEAEYEARVLAKKLKKQESKKKNAAYREASQTLRLTRLQFQVAADERRDEIASVDHGITMATESHSGTFRLYGSVDSNSMERLRIATARYAAANPKGPITFIISSGGGGVFDGYVLFDQLRALSEAGHHITTVIRGIAGSMAGVLSQAGDTRIMGPEAYIVIHEASMGAWGKASDLGESVELLKRLCRQSEEVYARRSTLTAAQIRARSVKTDWYINAKQAKEFGFVDQVA